MSTAGAKGAFQLQAKNLSVGWNGGAVLQGANFTVDFAEFNNRVPVVGRTGSGKTTMLYALAAQARPLDGRIEWNLGLEGQFAITGPDLDHRTGMILRRRYFGFAFQDAALVPHLTVKENIRLPLELQHRRDSGAEIDERADQLIANVLTPNETVAAIGARFPDQLSGGQRQRMAFAQAMASDPMVLFSDEPTGSLDSETRHEVMRCVNAWVDAEPHRCFLWITHHRDPFEFENAPFALQLTHEGGQAIVRTIPSELLHGGPGNDPGRPAPALVKEALS